MTNQPSLSVTSSSQAVRISMTRWRSGRRHSQIQPAVKRISLPICQILNLTDYIVHQNCLFAHDCINGNLPTPLLDDRITFVQTPGNTRAERLNQLVNFRTKTVLYGSNSIKSRAVKAWNDVNIELHHLMLQDVSKSICKKRIYEYLLDKYPGDNRDTSFNQ